jgi:membrane associated rhomboid family serine protease
MMPMPLGVAGRSNFRPYATFTLIALNVLIFIITLGFTIRGEAYLLAFAKRYALDVCLVGIEPLGTSFLKGIGSMFIHGGLAHLVGNMTMLWIFGPRVEGYFGHKRFVLFYLTLGYIAFIAHILLGGTTCIIGSDINGLVVGASGAIAGVMGTFLFLFPSARIRTAILLFGVLPIKVFFVNAWLYLAYWFVLDFMKGIGWISSAGVAHWAHIGGFIGGMVIVFVATLYKPAPKSDPFAYLDD